MKKIKLLIVLLCVALMLSGCSNLRMAASIDELISPIAASGDNAKVQSAVDEYCKGGYSIKIPAGGKYTTSFIFYDIDNDGSEEALAFYEPSSEMGTVSMAVLKKNSSKWSVVENIESSATDVSCVDFCDLNDDGFDEIIVCWSVVSKTTGFKLNVYRQITNSDSSYELESVSDDVTASDFICVDIDGDDVDELMVFCDGSSSEYPQAQLYSYEDNTQELLGSTKLDGTITSFESIVAAETDEGMSVYADAICSDGTSMVTELIYWSDYYDSIISPFYSYSSSRTTETERICMITSSDIDGDGVVEIPIDADKDGLPSEISAQNWKVYGNTVLSHKCYSVSCSRDGFVLLIDDDFFDSVEIEYDSAHRLFSVKDSDGADAFEILTVVKTSYDSSSDEYSDYVKIFDNSGFVYLAKIFTDSSLEIDAQTLEDMIKAY